MLRRLKRFCVGVREDLRVFDRQNTDEARVLESTLFSAYRCCPVLRLPGRRSGSLGVLFLTRSASQRPDGRDLVRHEYGHRLQLRRLGLWRYLRRIGLPSWRHKNAPDYYAQPWEVTADLLGGVTGRHHTPEAEKAGWDYLKKYKKRTGKR